MKVFTTGQVARICKVAPRTVSKWFDSGRLPGYRIPGSLDRRIPREYLAKFVKDHGMSSAETRSACYVNAILIAQPTDFARRIQNVLVMDGRFDVTMSSTAFDAGMAASDVFPDVVIVDCDATIGIRSFLRCVAARPEARLTTFVLLLPEGPEPVYHDLTGRTEGFRKPFDPMLLKERLVTIVCGRKGWN
jgi:excisionase family DNA binding protein